MRLGRRFLRGDDLRERIIHVLWRRLMDRLTFVVALTEVGESLPQRIATPVEQVGEQASVNRMHAVLGAGIRYRRDSQLFLPLLCRRRGMIDEELRSHRGVYPWLRLT